MKGRRVLALAIVAALAAGPSLALDLVDRILADLRTQGYTQIDVGRTLLGRTQITAVGPEFRREIVMDPRTGEILRDYWEVVASDDSAFGGNGLVEPPEVDDSSGSGSGSSGSGSGSGSGSSGSGSGGSGSNSGSGSSGSGSGSGGSGSGGSGSGGSGSGGSGSGGSDDDGSDG